MEEYRICLSRPEKSYLSHSQLETIQCKLPLRVEKPHWLIIIPPRVSVLHFCDLYPYWTAGVSTYVASLPEWYSPSLASAWSVSCFELALPCVMTLGTKHGPCLTGLRPKPPKRRDVATHQLYITLQPKRPSTPAFLDLTLQSMSLLLVIK